VRPLLKHLINNYPVTLAFVSGRRLDLQLQAITEYDLPVPEFLVADVGASIYQNVRGSWKPDSQWHDVLATGWQGRQWQDLTGPFAKVPGLRLQPEEAQAAHKLSFEVANPALGDQILSAVRQILNRICLDAELIWSVDETCGLGLLDVMAPGATKLNAVRHVANKLQLPPSQVLCCGDSGNDLPMLTGEFPAVLVANATDEVRQQAAAWSTKGSTPCYQAKGGFLGMNGCYGAGILEGMAHFFPAYRAPLQQQWQTVICSQPNQQPII
jgi:HAD superfamily hydrolase (TIGR01484 family)